MAPLSNRVRGVVVGVALAASAVLVAGCGAGPGLPLPGYEQLPADASGWTTSYETFCNHGHRIYGSNQGGMAVVPNDPSCNFTQ